MLITPEYREQQRQLHETTEYGTASIQYAPLVAELMNLKHVTDLLDYGAGRMNLIKTLKSGNLVAHEFKYTAYEPSSLLYGDPPEPAEMVACIDVLEHIEPSCLNEVLNDLKRVTKRIGLFTVSTQLAKKVLPDGRNAHLIVEPMEWWMPQIESRFRVLHKQLMPGGFWVTVGTL